MKQLLVVCLTLTISSCAVNKSNFEKPKKVNFLGGKGGDGGKGENGKNGEGGKDGKSGVVIIKTKQQYVALHYF
jgi:hypothetical protein